MKDLKSMFIHFLVGVIFAIISSAFLWGVFSVVNGSINGNDWKFGAGYFYGALSVIFLVGCVFFTVGKWLNDN